MPGSSYEVISGPYSSCGITVGRRGGEAESKKGSSFVKLLKITKVASFSIFSPRLSILSTPGQSSDNNFQNLD
jgi:hypothetical protein